MTGVKIFFLTSLLFSLDTLFKNYFLDSGFYVRKNYGIVFGLFQNSLTARTVFLGLTIFILAWVLWRSQTNRSRLGLFSSCLILSGVLGNWFDYFFRGYVVDPLSLRDLLPFWPVNWASYFNLADVFILLGFILMGAGSVKLRPPIVFPGGSELSP